MCTRARTHMHTYTHARMHTHVHTNWHMLHTLYKANEERARPHILTLRVGRSPNCPAESSNFFPFKKVLYRRGHNVKFVGKDVTKIVTI